MSRIDSAATHAIAIDGVQVGSEPQILTQFMRCGAGAEHRLDLEFPLSTAAGPVGSSIAFLATLEK